MKQTRNVTTKQREVRITLKHGVYFVEYVDRKPRQRYLAAQFGADMRTREQVEQWVREQANLVLEQDAE
jgi:hypothetical protein